MMDNKHKILLAVGLTAIITDMIPTPADYFVFKAGETNKKLLDNKKITPKQYWQRNAAWYYLANPAYWALITLATFSIHKDFDKRVYIGIGLVSAGAVFAILNKNIREEQKSL